MKIRGYLVAGATLGLTALGSSALLADIDSDTVAGCIAPIAAYSSGLPAVANADALTPEQRIIETTMSFRKVMSAADRSQVCFEGALSEASADERVALEKGIEDANRILSTAQAQFGEALDFMSPDLLTDMEPAAGEGTEADLEAEAQNVSAMEILFDSYMVLERSQEINKRLVGVRRKG